MKILALIPARGGSKRLPGKNTKNLGGLPLIVWSIRAARESGCCMDVIVSTDDAEIASVATAHGASVPWLRPAELATDTATSVDVALHALQMAEKAQGPVDGLLLLQPTSPFRSAGAIQSAVNLYREGGGRHPIVSVGPARIHPMWCFRVQDRVMQPFMGWDAVVARSQDAEPAWTLNGSIYLISPERLRQEKRFITQDTWPLRMKRPEESVDIDTYSDWEEASNVARAAFLSRT
jgi:CMP-N-acetylneuraminic acid synthetase